MKDYEKFCLMKDDGYGYVAGVRFDGKLLFTPEKSVALKLTMKQWQAKGVFRNRYGLAIA